MPSPEPLRARHSSTRSLVRGLGTCALLLLLGACVGSGGQRDQAEGLEVPPAEPLSDAGEARYQLLATSFEDYEKTIRDQLTGLFGATGFDADRDIEAITVNRWSHGYAYDYRDLYDPEWPEGKAPHELGRKQLGRISFAGSDTEARAYVDAAIDAAWRAVQEQLEA